MTRKLLSGQRAELYLVDVDTAAATLRYVSDELLFEAPNWSPDGMSLVINGDGRLFRLGVDDGGLERIPLGGIAEINNDHILSPDGGKVYVSSRDGHIYAVELASRGPVAGDGTADGTGDGTADGTMVSTDTRAGATPQRVTNDNGPHFKHYLHGISPDGATLAYIGLAASDGQVRTNVYLVPSAGGPDVQLTNDHFLDDGAEFSPDGAWIYFNSERGSAVPGHAQLFRMPVPGGGMGDREPEQLTHDERVNWFPHPSPDGSKIAYVSFPSGTVGHPENVDVVVRILKADGTIRDMAHLYGGQGTMNVPSWSPDGRRLAIIAYPTGKAMAGQ